MIAQRRAVVGRGALSVVALIVALVLAPEASAQGQNVFPSDPERAVFRAGVNVNQCSDLIRDGVLDGLPGDVIQVGKNGPASGGNDFVTGTVTNNGHRLQVAITEAGTARNVEILAVVVKGGNGYNAYVRAEVLPPMEPPPQDYRAPLVGAGNPTVAEISHWFVCYTLGPPPPGSLRVSKRIENPVGVPVNPLPNAYRARVTCRNEAGEVVERRTFNFTAAGGTGTIGDTDRFDMTVPPGATCRVRELNTDALPAGCSVRYETSEGPSVEPPMVEEGQVEIVNDCQNVEVRRTGLDIVKRIVGFAPGELPDSFLVDVECTDGTREEVMVPASGEPGSVNGIRVRESCLVTERTGSLPPGTQVSYEINGSPSPEAGTAEFEVVGDERITVTVTNSRTPTPTPTPTPDLAPEPRPEMDPDKIVQGGVVRAGERVRYTIVVRNRGFAVARRVLVCDRLPRDLTLVSAPGARVRNGRICWRIARLSPLASRRFTLTARANPRASGGTTNVATADARRAAERTARARVTIRPQRRLPPPPVTG
jgi:uncharacterized repeat protein (TIGR01451 family)